MEKHTIMGAELNCEVVSMEGRLKLSVPPGTMARSVRQRGIKPWRPIKVFVCVCL